MSYTSIITENIRKYKELEIIDAKKIYKNKFIDIPESTYYKVLSRLEKSGEIQRVSKGFYCKPKKSRFGSVISNQKNIVEYFSGKNQTKGLVVGYELFNKYGITTQISKRIEIYSSVPIQEITNIRNVSIIRSDLKFDSSTIKNIELLEILERYSSIEDLNKVNLINFIEEAVKCYDEKTVKRIIKTLSYKKSTLASLRNVLEFFNKENSINEYLSGVSKYDSIDMEELYELAS